MQRRLFAITILCCALSAGWAQARERRHRAKPAGDTVTIVAPFGFTGSNDFKDHPVVTGSPRLGRAHRHRHIRHHRR